MHTRLFYDYNLVRRIKVMNIKFNLINPARINIILPLLVEMNEGIACEVLEARLSQMITQGYECVGIYDEGRLVGICGLWVLVKHYIGRHLEPDNVYLKSSYRNKGIGDQLQTYLEDFAISRGCEAVELNCYVDNDAGCRFWESLGYSQIGKHYRKSLIQNK